MGGSVGFHLSWVTLIAHSMGDGPLERSGGRAAKAERALGVVETSRGWKLAPKDSVMCQKFRETHKSLTEMMNVMSS